MPYYEGRFQNVDSVTGRDSAEKTVTQSDVTMTVPILSFYAQLGQFFPLLICHEVPLHLALSDLKVNTVWLMVLVRYSYCNALSCLPSLFLSFQQYARNDDCIDASQHDFRDSRYLPSKTNYQFHMVSGTQFVILRFQILIVLYYLIASQFMRVTDIMSGIYNLKREHLVNDK